MSAPTSTLRFTTCGAMEKDRRTPVQPSTTGEMVMMRRLHTSAPSEPLITRVAELYGDQSTYAPRSPATLGTTSERWLDAVTQVGEQVRAKLRVQVLPERLHKALALVLVHAVTLHPNGTASVQRGTQIYTLAPECSCANAVQRTAFCQHTLAVELHRRALALLDGTVPAQAPSATSSTTAPHASTALLYAVTPPASAQDFPKGQPSSADCWDGPEAPASCDLRLRVGALEFLYSMWDVSDAKLTSRMQHLLPWVHDLLGQARHTETPTVPIGWCPLYQVSMAQRSNAYGSWSSHWLASEQRYCKGAA